MADRRRLFSIVAGSAAATAFLAPSIADAFFGGLGFLGIIAADVGTNCDAACAAGAGGAAAAAAAWWAGWFKSFWAPPGTAPRRTRDYHGPWGRGPQSAPPYKTAPPGSIKLPPLLRTSRDLQDFVVWIGGEEQGDSGPAGYKVDALRPHNDSDYWSRSPD